MSLMIQSYTPFPPYVPLLLCFCNSPFLLGIFTRGKRQFFRYLKKVPAVRRKIEAELSKANQDFQGEISKLTETLSYCMSLPERGLTKEEILKQIDEHLKLGHYDWRDGRVSGAVYGYKEDLAELVTKVYGKASYTNPLHPDIFPGVCKMEAEVVRMALSLFQGNEDGCGTVS